MTVTRMLALGLILLGSGAQAIGAVFPEIGVAWAENYLVHGEQASRIDCRISQTVSPDADTRNISLSYVLPGTFRSPTYTQEIHETAFEFQPEPTERTETRDNRGNSVVTVTWIRPGQSVEGVLHLTAETRLTLDRLNTAAPFPVATVPDAVRAYLEPTAMVQSTDPAISAMARELTAGARTQFDAVQQLLTWVVDHLRYVQTPERFDARYGFTEKRGNCQNYSHLAAALMRAAGIPVRIVNGFTLKKPYDIDVADTILTIKMGEGRHSWIEVHFQDLGWVPFDPQSSELFVSNRFLRVEVGIDNQETIQDGLLRWTRVAGSKGRPRFTESVQPRFDADRVVLAAVKTDYGPRGLLLCPDVASPFVKVPPPPLPEPPPPVARETLRRLTFHRPVVFGNLDFPEGIDFLTVASGAETEADGNLALRRNFLVETAEYVTTRGQQYAQTFILQRPLELHAIGLALHRFNQDGQLWLEIYTDDGGVPGAYVGTSDLLALEQMPYTPGYAWVDFNFARSPLRLSPGRYWMALGFTDGPIVNWFFTYGKPVGPQDGTRYRTLFDTGWSRSLSYEFNYRISGLAADTAD